MELKKQFAKIKKDDVFICPTDTVYGISASVDNKNAINRIKSIKQRENGTFIVLIYSIKDLDKFSVILTGNQKLFLEKNWPGKISVILSISSGWSWLGAKDNTIAFRVPEHEGLRDFIKNFGPIVSTSANMHKQDTVTNIDEAKRLFGKNIDIYIDGGELTGDASTLIKILR